jgi:hypothetical protein
MSSSFPPCFLRFLFRSVLFVNLTCCLFESTNFLAPTVQYNLFDWQSLQPDVGPGAMFFEFCDALEVKDGVSAGPQGWGLDNAIYSWGNFWNTTYYNYGMRSP